MTFKTLGFVLISLLSPLIIFSQNKEPKNIAEISNEMEANIFVNSLDLIFSSSLKILTREELRNIKLETDRASGKETSLLSLSDELGIKNYEIIDFDNNGNVDLIIRGDSGGLKTLLVMDMGNGVYEEIYLSQDEDILIKAGVLDNAPIIEYYFYDCNRKNTTKTLWKNILIYKYNEIIEYDDRDKKLEIKEIIFETGLGYKSEPKFQMKINNNGIATIKANSYIYKKDQSILNRNFKELDGNYTSKIEKNRLDKLMEILNYINFSQVQKDCEVSTNEFPCKMQIIYNNGTIKNIHKYKNDLPFSLEYILELIWSFRDEQNWEKDRK